LDTIVSTKASLGVMRVMGYSSDRRMWRMDSCTGE
jgi:hypothetical protein